MPLRNLTIKKDKINLNRNHQWLSLIKSITSHFLRTETYDNKFVQVGTTS